MSSVKVLTVIHWSEESEKIALNESSSKKKKRANPT